MIGGKEQVVGHDRQAVDDAIAATAARPMVKVSAHKGDARGEWVVDLAPAELSAPATIWVVTYDTRHDVDIQRGENSGRNLAYHNVVRKMDRLRTWDGRTALSLSLDMKTVWAAGHDGCAVIVQEDGYGPILGVARLAVD